MKTVGATAAKSTAPSPGGTPPSGESPLRGGPSGTNTAAVDSAVPELPLRKSPELFFGGLLGALVATGGTVSLWESGHPAWGTFVACFVPIALYMAVVGQKAKCPRCENAISVIRGTGPFRCDKCPAYGYFQIQGKKLVPVPPGTVTFINAFSIHLWDLALETPINLPWEGGCCVCRKPTAHVKKVACSVSGDVIPGWVERIKSLPLEIPCCPEHEDGVSQGQGTVDFTTYDYWLEFVRLNGRLR